MQKKLIALAVAGLASSAAFAQTNVTLGGNVEVGYAGGENKSSISDGVDSDKYKNTWSKFRGTDNEGWTSSQLTINVVEDLGNGLKAGYDHAIALGIFAPGDGVDEGYSSGNSAFQRTRMSRAYLASNNWGRLAIGYQYTVEDQIQGIGRAGSGNLSNIGEAYNAKGVKGFAAIGAGDITRANMFEYASPVWSGLQVIAQAGYTDDETTVKTNGLKTQDDDVEGQLYGIGLKYANGPLALGAAVQYSDPTSDKNPGVSTEAEKTTYILSGNYDFKVAKVFGRLFYRDGNQTDKSGGVKTVDADTTYKGGDIGVHVPFANRWKFIATAGMANQEFDDGLSSAKGEFDIWAYQVALTYDFSKRTSVTAYWAQNKFDGDKDLDGQTDKRMVGGVGLRHSF